MVIDLGEQWSEAFQKTNHKVMITWEVTDESTTIDGEEKPRVISKEYTLSLSQKATLRSHLRPGEERSLPIRNWTALIW